MLSSFRHFISLHAHLRMSTITCRPKPLSNEQAERAVRRSIEMNPDNAAEFRTVERTPVRRRGGARRLAVLVGNRWPKTGVKLTVEFLDNPTRSLRKKVLEHMNAWKKTCHIDAGRESFLATEEIHLVRNVLTAVPASSIPPKPGPLRILVAAAQPIGLGIGRDPGTDECKPSDIWF